MRGITYENFQQFEKFINKQLKTRTRKIKVVYIPVTRDQLIPWLVAGRGDIAAANLTITEKRSLTNAFTAPLTQNISEIIVTGPKAPSTIKNLEALSGKDVHVGEPSSYYSHLIHLNKSLDAKNLSPINIVKTSEFLEDSDLIEMVNARLIARIVVD